MAGHVVDFAICVVVVFLLSGHKVLKAEAGLQNQYLGCFFDEHNITLSQSAIVKYRITIEECLRSCKETTYVGFKDGMTCECRNDYGSQVPDRFCYTECAGNSSLLCGGERHNFTYVYVLYSVCPVGTYGSPGCENACHCDLQVPCDRLTGACPGRCQENFSGPSCNLISLSHQYIGCYKDVNLDRAMQNLSNDETNRTIENCLNYCVNLKSTYAGTQYSLECFCGESYNKHGLCKDNEPRCSCNMSCRGNKSQICGGAHAISVYHVCPAGYYGSGCRQMCNCANGDCNFQTGFCRNSTCKSGWGGRSCNVRNCSLQNGGCNPNESCEVIETNNAKVSVCRCREGFRKIKLSDSCTDINECSEAPLADLCGTYAIDCTNAIGGYNCTCSYDTDDGKGRCTKGGRDATEYRTLLMCVILVSFTIIVTIVATCLCRRLRSTRTVPENKGTSSIPQAILDSRSHSGNTYVENTYMYITSAPDVSKTIESNNQRLKNKRSDKRQLRADRCLQSHAANSKVERMTSTTDDSRTEELTYMTLERRSDKEQVYEELRLCDYENIN